MEGWEGRLGGKGMKRRRERERGGGGGRQTYEHGETDTEKRTGGHRIVNE